MKHIIIHSDAYPTETLCLYTRHCGKHPTIFSYKGLFNITVRYFSSPPKEGICRGTSAGPTALGSRRGGGRGAAPQTFSALLWEDAPGSGGAAIPRAAAVQAAELPGSSSSSGASFNFYATPRHEQDCKTGGSKPRAIAFVNHQIHNQETKTMHPVPAFPAAFSAFSFQSATPPQHQDRPATYGDPASSGALDPHLP